jgi:quinol monooxygenase YgiN
MAFIQIIEFHTSKADEVQALEDEWEQATEGKRTVRRSIITQDRNDPSRYLVVVFFDSYESATENSTLPETQALAEKQGALLDGPPVFHDLDVIDDRS